MWQELLKQLLIGVIIVYVLFGAYLYFAQKSLIYFPDNTLHSECHAFSERAEHNNTRMYIERGDDRVLVVYHGNAGRACDRTYLSEFSERTLVLVEYEGYAGQGVPSSNAHHQNVRDVHEWLLTQGFSDVAVLGESLGTGLAAYHASLGGVGRVVLVAPYTTLAAVAQHHYRVYPGRLLLREQYSTESLHSFDGDILVVHGSTDNIIPAHLSESLPGTRVIVEAGHNDLLHHSDVRKVITEILA